MQIFTSRRGGDIAGLCADVVDDGFLQPRNKEMSAFVHHGIFDSGETIEDYSACAAFDVVDGGLSEGEANGDWNRIFVDCAENVRHFEDFKISPGDNATALRYSSSITEQLDWNETPGRERAKLYDFS